MIYFLQPTEGGPVKIGHSGDVDARRRQLETLYGVPLALLGTLPGGRPEETEIHERFAHLRFGRTEQFRPTAELMEFVGRPLLVDVNPDAVEVMQPVTETLRRTPVRIGDEAVRIAKIAASFKDMSLAEYLSDLIMTHAPGDIDEGHSQLSKGAKAPKAPKGRGPK